MSYYSNKGEFNVSKQISPERKFIYYLGLGLIALGVILFLSGFISGPLEGMERFGETPAFFKRGIFGVGSIIIGLVLTSIGAKGAAGSGLILDPERARNDLKPFNEVKGEMIGDVLDNIGVVTAIVENIKINNEKNLNEVQNVNTVKEVKEVKEVIKIKCRKCSTLNDVDSKFCKGCGEEL